LDTNYVAAGQRGLPVLRIPRVEISGPLEDAGQEHGTVGATARSHTTPGVLPVTTVAS
jgi:hypothetical protein